MGRTQMIMIMLHLQQRWKQLCVKEMVQH